MPCETVRIVLMVDSMVVNRRRVLSGTLAVGGMLVSGCYAVPAVRNDSEPAVPWPDGDTLGIGLESYPYPHPVHYLDVTHVARRTGSTVRPRTGSGVRVWRTWTFRPTARSQRAPS